MTTTIPNTEHTALLEVLRSAQALLEAREDQMVTRIEWEALERAVAATLAAGGQPPA